MHLLHLVLLLKGTDETPWRVSKPVCLADHYVLPHLTTLVVVVVLYVHLNIEVKRKLNHQ